MNNKKINSNKSKNLKKKMILAKIQDLNHYHDLKKKLLMQ